MTKPKGYQPNSRLVIQLVAQIEQELSLKGTLRVNQLQTELGVSGGLAKYALDCMVREGQVRVTSVETGYHGHTDNCYQLANNAAAAVGASGASGASGAKGTNPFEWRTYVQKKAHG